MPVERVPAGADGGVGSGSAGASASAASAIDVSISSRSKSARPSMMSSNGTSRPSRRQMSHASTHIALRRPGSEIGLPFGVAPLVDVLDGERLGHGRLAAVVFETLRR